MVENDIGFLTCEHVPTRHSTLHVLLQDRSTAVQLRTAKGRVSANLLLFQLLCLSIQLSEPVHCGLNKHRCHHSSREEGTQYEVCTELLGNL